MAAHDDDTADPNRALRPPKPVGDPPARDANEIGGRRIEAVDRGRRLIRVAEAAFFDLLHHEQDQQRAHAVVAEALPHFREEQRREPARVAEDLRALTRGSDCMAHRGFPFFGAARLERAARGQVPASFSTGIFSGIMILATKRPASYSKYIGTASSVIENTSAASSMPATKQPRKT